MNHYLTMIIVAVLFIVMGIPAVRNVGDPKFAGMMAAKDKADIVICPLQFVVCHFV